MNTCLLVRRHPRDHVGTAQFRQETASIPMTPGARPAIHRKGN